MLINTDSFLHQNIIFAMQLGKGWSFYPESQNLATWAVYVNSRPLGVQILISYDRSPDGNISKAHIFKAEEFIAGSYGVRFNQRPYRDPTMCDDENERQSNRPKIQINIMFPSIVDAHSI